MENDSFTTGDLAAYGISQGLNVWGAISAVDAKESAAVAKMKAIGQAINATNTMFLMQQNVAYEQSAAVDNSVGDMMSRNGLDAMKAEARLAASAAGSGTTGGTTDVAIREARSVNMFDNAIVAARGEDDKLNIQRKLLFEQASWKNRTDKLISDIGNVWGSMDAYTAAASGWNWSQNVQPDWLKEGNVSSSLEKSTFWDLF